MLDEMGDVYKVLLVVTMRFEPPASAIDHCCAEGRVDGGGGVGMSA